MKCKYTKQTFLIAFLLFFVVGLLFSSMQIREAKATIIVSRTFSSLSYDGDNFVEGADYQIVWNSTFGTAMDYAQINIIGQRYPYLGTWYLIWRSFLYFDTSIIPNNAAITSAILSIYIEANYSITDFNVTVQNGQPTYPHIPEENGDYNKAWYSGDGGSRNTSEILALGYFNITLNTDGISWISKTETTKLCLRSDRDINGQAPSTYEWIDWYGSEKGEAYAPKLYVTYETEVIVTITYPTNTTYTTSTIPVQLSATGGTIDTIWYNCKNATSWIYPSNITYTTPTSMTGFINGTYTFYGWANNTDGSNNEETIMFSVAIPSIPIVTLTIFYPQNTTYTTSTIPVEIIATDGTIDKIWWNCKKGTSWIYNSNQTYTSPTNMIGFVNGIYTFYAWANNTNGNSDSENVGFTVAIPSPPPGTVNLYFPITTKLAFQHCSSIYGVTPFTVTLTVNSGTLNGTSTTLTMTEAYGILNFRNLEATTVALTSTSPDETQIKVNGELYSAPVSFTPNQDVTIIWEYFKPEFLLPIMFILGMIGLVGMFVGPIYTIRKTKKGEYYDAFRGGVIVTAVSIALFIAWLW